MADLRGECIRYVTAQLPDPELRSFKSIHVTTALELEAAGYVSFTESRSMLLDVRDPWS